MTGQVVVAGASAGIGDAVVRALLREGLDVVALGRDSAKLSNSLARWLSLFPERRVDAECVDLSTLDSLPLLQTIADRYEALSGLVVVAGSGAPGEGSLVERHVSGQNRNILPSLMCLETFETPLRAAKDSAVVLVSSIAGREYIPCPPEYASAKASLHAYCSHWTRLLTPVRVNVVAPGNVASEDSVWQRRQIEEPEALAEMLTRDVPLGRLGSPGEIAAVVKFLLSSEASFVTGAVVVADGGQSRSW